MNEKTITRNDIALEIHKQIGLSTNEADKIVSQFFSSVIDGLNDTGSVKLTNFGTLTVLNKKERIGRNPRTKEKAIISARKVANFRASDTLKNLINK
ncbi:MAG: HU family DNA-binding protein [Alphaproteobacteria bacterium]